MNPPPPTAEATPSQVRRPGVTPPSRRGGSGRRLDDVVVDLGFVDRPTMDGAVAEAQRTGSNPERVLLQAGRIDEDQLSRAVAERFGLDVERARLLPAGLLILDAAVCAIGRPLQVGNGGLREGVCLELAGQD